MSCQEIFRESNEMVGERYELVMERIGKIPQEKSALEKYQDYFLKVAEFLLLADHVMCQGESGELDRRTLEECRETNRKLYRDILLLRTGK